MKDEHGHCFCRSCIRIWIDKNKTCPINKEPILYEVARPIPIALSRILSKYNY